MSKEPGAEAERLAGRRLAREIRAGVEHFVPGQHHATIEVRGGVDYFDPSKRGDIGRVTYVDSGGALCVVLTWRDERSDKWEATWVSRAGMFLVENPRRADGFLLSEKMLAALAKAEERET